MELSQKIEALLFYLSEPVEYSYLMKVLEVSEDELIDGLKNLTDNLVGRGVGLVFNKKTVMLSTSSELSGLIEKVMKEERERDLGRAGAETLAVIAYKGPVSRKEIEYIRGVNCQFVLRSLLLRGLVAKESSQKDERVMLYSISTESLMHLGLSSVEDLPEYKNVQDELAKVEKLDDNMEEKGGE